MARLPFPSVFTSYLKANTESKFVPGGTRTERLCVAASRCFCRVFCSPPRLALPVCDRVTQPSCRPCAGAARRSRTPARSRVAGAACQAGMRPARRLLGHSSFLPVGSPRGRPLPASKGAGLVEATTCRITGEGQTPHLATEYEPALDGLSCTRKRDQSGVRTRRVDGQPGRRLRRPWAPPWTRRGCSSQGAV